VGYTASTGNELPDSASHTAAVIAALQLVVTAAMMKSICLRMELDSLASPGIMMRSSGCHQLNLPSAALQGVAVKEQ